MKEDIKFSILVPAFKARFLAECIDSILSQTYTNLELIIVNDASPENLDEIVSRYDDARIQYYVNEKNFGAINVVDNWNKCLSYATGEYVICMGDDDKLMPCCLEEYRKLIGKYPEVDVLHGRTIIMNEDRHLNNFGIIQISLLYADYLLSLYICNLLQYSEVNSGQMQLFENNLPIIRNKLIEYNIKKLKDMRRI